MADSLFGNSTGNPSTTTSNVFLVQPDSNPNLNVPMVGTTNPTGLSTIRTDRSGGYELDIGQEVYQELILREYAEKKANQIRVPDINEYPVNPDGTWSEGGYYAKYGNTDDYYVGLPVSTTEYIELGIAPPVGIEGSWWDRDGKYTETGAYAWRTLNEKIRLNEYSGHEWTDVKAGQRVLLGEYKDMGGQAPVGLYVDADGRITQEGAYFTQTKPGDYAANVLDPAVYGNIFNLTPDYSSIDYSGAYEVPRSNIPNYYNQQASTGKYSGYFTNSWTLTDLGASQIRSMGGNYFDIQSGERLSPDFFYSQGVTPYEVYGSVDPIINPTTGKFTEYGNEFFRGSYAGEAATLDDYVAVGYPAEKLSTMDGSRVVEGYGIGEVDPALAKAAREAPTGEPADPTDETVQGGDDPTADPNAQDPTTAPDYESGVASTSSPRGATRYPINCFPGQGGYTGRNARATAAQSGDPAATGGSTSPALDAPNPTTELGDGTLEPNIPTQADVAETATFTDAINLDKLNLIGVSGTDANRRGIFYYEGKAESGIQAGVNIYDNQFRVNSYGDNTASVTDLSTNKTITLEIPE